MPILTVATFKRADIRAHPERLYVFGDNFVGLGFGGQARECRGEPNCVGIPTKRAPHMRDSAFFTDADLPEWRTRSSAAFAKINKALARGRTVVMPAAGLGTGLAQLKTRAPKIWKELEEEIAGYAGVNFEITPNEPTPNTP